MKEQEKIAQILSRIDTGTCTPEELAWLQSWYDAQEIPASQVFSHEADRLQIQQDMLSDIHAAIHQSAAAIPFYRRYWVAAAVLLGVVFTAGFYYYKYSRAHEMLLATAGPGQMKSFLLPDSSKVWLNAGATIKYPRTFGKIRTVQLEGEAFFDIHPDARHPFEVHTTEINVQVLGTSFDVKAHPLLDETQVTVKTGMVKILHQQKGLDVLSADDQLTFSRSAQQYMKSTVSNDQVNEWMDGRIALAQVGFAELALTLENQYGVKIRYNPAEMKQDEYTLRCSNKLTIQQVLDIVSGIHPLQYEMNGNEITIHK
ncbi:FecR family protein [Chitinophaga sp. sic0106]|uniref:FecR family protein n=1 Tax=Chitinophaga sp. sic0106 TaxID=2854785 RepID=UPI001C43CC2C|nr:FecR family protein [Chitinophaga sp. sic0106]MBV7533981.1 FecR domain-containing protein [Chitinophaga sp. sic0106]